MFQIISDAFGDGQRLKIVNGKTGEYVSVLPHFGANVNELVLKKRDKFYSLIKGNKTPEELAADDAYKSAKLIPFPNRIKGGQYHFENQEHQLFVNFPHEGNAIHGFVFDKPFVVEGQDIKETHAQISLSYTYKGDIEGYPFPFELKITYGLHNTEGFFCKTKVINTGETTMPFADGWHPYFTFGKKVDELFLKFPSRFRILVDENLIPTGDKVDYEAFCDLRRIGETNFDTCYLLKDEKDRHIVEVEDRAENVKIILWQEAGKYNYLQIYIPPTRDTIALEPMTCNVNVFNNRNGLVVLQPGQPFKGSYGLMM